MAKTATESPKEERIHDLILSMSNSVLEPSLDMDVEMDPVPRLNKGKGKMLEARIPDLPDEVWGLVFDYYYEDCRAGGLPLLCLYSVHC